MLAKRVILGLTFNEGVLMRTKRFVPDYRYTAAFSWSPDADELVLIDVTPQPTHESNSIFLGIVEKYCRDSGLPMTVANHIRTADDAKPLFDRGADRVLVSWKGRDCYEEIAGRWGSNALVAGIDYRSESSDSDATEQKILAVCNDLRGAGEILLTSIERDGSLGGYDIPTLRRVSGSVKTPIIVAGGCGGKIHIKEAFEAGAAGAVTTVIHHFAPSALRGTKEWLVKNYDGPVRP